MIIIAKYDILLPIIHPEAFMTEMTIFQKNLMEKLPNVELRFDEPMSRHTSFRIGGPVAVMHSPRARRSWLRS